MPQPVFKVPTFRVRLILWRGALRRFYLNTFRPAYVREQLSRRQGECLRCGACCHLGHLGNGKCLRLRPLPDGGTTCLFYNCRTSNCRTFPIDPRDLADRDLIAPTLPCGYHWHQ
jgi:hypothetical protein